MSDKMNDRAARNARELLPCQVAILGCEMLECGVHHYACPAARRRQVAAKLRKLYEEIKQLKARKRRGGLSR